MDEMDEINRALALLPWYKKAAAMKDMPLYKLRSCIHCGGDLFKDEENFGYSCLSCGRMAILWPEKPLGLVGALGREG